MSLDEKEFENIALHSSGYLSSTMVDYPFEYAVDGITTNDNAHARTNFEDFPYLVLDFGRNVSIDRVEIFGILDAPYFRKSQSYEDVHVFRLLNLFAIGFRPSSCNLC